MDCPVPGDRMLAAMLAADPALVARRKMANMGEAGAPEAVDKPTKAWTKELKSFENAARVRVRRVVAALNGIDIEANASPWTDPPAIVTRETITELCEALCADQVYAAVEKTIGPERAAALMGAITAL